MSSQFNAFAATTHRADLHRAAERTRQLEDLAAAAENPLPTMLRSRRLGRLVRIIPSPSRPSA
jgi:hypothetical protein